MKVKGESEVAQLCLTLSDPMDCSRLHCPWDVPSKSTGVGCHCLLQMEYYSAIKKNAFESVLMRWMKLEPIIQSEVSQKEKHQYSILMHKYGI